MVFSQPSFLFLFFPLLLLFYFIVPRKFKNSVLLISSLIFYAWGERFYTIIMIISIFFNYLMGLFIDAKHEPQQRKFLIIITLIGNLGILIYFKYANFLTNSIDTVLSYIGLPLINLKPVHLPIGISFFTFQALSYTLDIYSGKVKAQRNPASLALYISLFPQLIAGPIVRYSTISDELYNRKIDPVLFSSGINRFVIGLTKKMAIANPAGFKADQIFALSVLNLNSPIAWFGLLCYTLQIFFDFSGYSDMAIGLGRMFGFNFLENFNYPYSSKSITDFWRRWHISLSTWFKDYLYIPLGGNRASTFKTYRNLLFVFIICGFWHGASWNFLIWGLIHGILLIPNVSDS